MTDLFYLFLLTFYGELGTGYYPLKKVLIKKFPCDIPRLARLSYVNIFQGSLTPWSMLRYVDLDVLC